tara:strand:+ start:176 stop:568 length:393 start_codon:yes stop_codon:yes gene_type:complete
MRQLLFLFATFLSIFFPLSVSANSVFSCEAKRVEGDNKMLNIKEFKNIIYPTILIDNEKDTLLYFYSEHDMQWETNFKLIDRSENNLVAIEELSANKVLLIHFNLKEKEFSLIYAAPMGHTLTFGKCYGN